MQLLIHQTHHNVAAFDKIFSYLKESYKNDDNQELHIFPEMFLTGYPLQDLCLQKPFYSEYEQLLQQINRWSENEAEANSNKVLLMGGLNYIYDDSGLPKHIENVIFYLEPGKKLKPIYTKILLPNYDIFDERKYFTPGKEPKVLKIFDKNIALLICEDMWPSTAYDIDPVKKLEELNQSFDLVVNLSASPYNLDKQEKRIARASAISQSLKVPFAYVNRVGSEDEIIFDGNSFFVNGNEVVARAKAYASDLLTIEVPDYNEAASKDNSQEQIINTWETLFAPNLVDGPNKMPILKPLTDEECEDLVQALSFGVQEYAIKCNFNKFTIALSGGLDSSLVLAILKLSLKPGQEIEAIYMPSQFSRDISFDLSKELCDNINVPLYVFPIAPIHDACRQMFVDQIKEPLTGLADENIQSRIRGMLLFARSNQWGSIVINTSNKSELSVGYSTIYGDSVGAISLLGDVFKSEAFELARYISRKHNNMIPAGIIERPPSAELRDDQEDTDSLPPYERLDAMLEGILSYRMNYKQLLDSGFIQEEVERVFNLYRKTEYKRIQFCPVIKVKAKSFGFGYRIPVCKDSNFYIK